MLEFIVGVVIGAIFGVSIFLLKPLRSIPQNDAEVAVTSALRRYFTNENYHLINNVTLKKGQSTTQVDHILISRYGIFIIETKGYKGWIYGSEKDRKWTQVIYRAKFRFGNPIKQNAGHVAAVRSLLPKLDSNVFHSIVVFCGQAKFKTELPSNVLYHCRLVEYLSNFTDETLTYSQLVYIVGRIETQRLDRSSDVDEYHRNNVAKQLEQRKERLKQSWI